MCLCRENRQLDVEQGDFCQATVDSMRSVTSHTQQQPQVNFFSKKHPCCIPMNHSKSVFERASTLVLCGWSDDVKKEVDLAKVAAVGFEVTGGLREILKLYVNYSNEKNSQNRTAPFVSQLSLD